MSLFSFLRKNKQQSPSDDSAFYSRAEGEPGAVRSRSKRKQNTQGPVDPVLPEKKRARRRLIGVVALVLAAVIGLPMILDSEPKPLADDIAIQIPSKDKAPSKEQPAQQPEGKRESAPSAASKVSPAASLDPKEEVLELPPAVQTKPAAPAVAAATERPKQSDKPSEPAKAAADKPAAAQALAKLDSRTDSRTDPHAADKSAEAARARALLEGKSDPKPETDNKSGKFIIQVAALASKEKVNELQAKLKDAGIRSYTQKIATESGERIRIRVGPFGSKEEADKVRARIGKLGLNGSIVPA